MKYEDLPRIDIMGAKDAALIWLLVTGEPFPSNKFDFNFFICNFYCDFDSTAGNRRSVSLEVASKISALLA